MRTRNGKTRNENRNEKRQKWRKKVAKAQARAKILDLLDILPLEGEEDSKGRNIIMHNKQMTDTNIAWGNSMRTGRNLYRVRNISLQ